MTPDERTDFWPLAFLIVGFVGGVFIGARYVADRMVPENIAPAPEVRQKDGSVILERKPDAKPKPPPHTIPAGSVEERRISIQVRPNVSKKARKPDTGPQDAIGDVCEPIDLTLSLLRSSEGIRALLSAPNGEIMGGVDTPITPAFTRADRKWAAGVSYDPFRESPGFWIERDFERIRTGLDLYQDRRGLDTGMAARVRLGWVFG